MGVLCCAIIYALAFIIPLISITSRVSTLEENIQEENIIVELESPWFFTQTPKEGLMDALEYYNIPHKDIVYAQAILETGHFNSKNCTQGNNLFGLYDSRAGRYMSFGHWVKSVELYKKCFSDKYTNPEEDYYEFLKRHHYADDPDYYKKVESIRRKINE